ESEAGQLSCLKEHGVDAVQRKRLSGLTWWPEIAFDRFVFMLQEQTVTYVRPELCTSRAQDALQLKQTETFSFGADGE
ncbi:unnamed protein product, partial [Symbiodinium microadriaticum]